MSHRPEKRYCTAIHKAIYAGKVAKVKRLLESGKIDVNSRTEKKETHLHYAMLYNKVECIDLLIIHGANPNKRSNSYYTALLMGVMTKNFVAVERLIDVCKKQGVFLNLQKANALGETPLHFAAFHNIPKAVEILVAAGADINIRNLVNISPLNMAKENGHNKIVKYLREKGADRKILPRPPRVTEFSLPENIVDGFLSDDRQKRLEEEYGGTLWESLLEVFYWGKKPKVGQTVDIEVHFKVHEYNRTKYSWLRGIIHTVSEDSKTIVSTVHLNVDHEGHIPALEGDWEATLQLDLGKKFPWLLTKLVPNTNPLYTYANLKQVAKQQEEARGGKKFILAKPKEKRCSFFKGAKHDHAHEHSPDGIRIIVGLNVLIDGTMEVAYEDGTRERLDQEQTQATLHMAKQTIQEDRSICNHVKLMMQGIETPWDELLVAKQSGSNLKMFQEASK